MTHLSVAAGTPAVARAPGRRGRAGLWVVPPLVLVLGVFGYPMALVVAQSFTGADGHAGLGSWRGVVTSPEFAGALGRTVAISVSSTAGCVLLGTFLAFAVAFVPVPGMRAASRLVDMMLAFPSFLIALSFTFLYGGAGVLNAVLGPGSVDFLYTWWGVLLAEVTFYTPFVMRPMVAAFGQVPSDQLDVAASLGARPLTVLRRVVLPEVWPSLASATCLTLLLTMNEFGIVLFVGAKDVLTLPMLVYTKGIVTFDYSGACAVAVVNVVLSGLLYASYRWVSERGTDAAVDPA